MYIEALSIINSKNTVKDGRIEGDEERAAAGPANGEAFTRLDLEFVVSFAEDTGPDMFRTILHSICPSIYGHELVKGAALYCTAFCQNYFQTDFQCWICII